MSWYITLLQGGMAMPWYVAVLLVLAALGLTGGFVLLARLIQGKVPPGGIVH